MSKLTILFVGNPGSGKSTLLNGLAGENLFKFGESFGGGLTYQLDKKEVNGIIYADTPGLADKKLREASGKAISTALKAGGAYKIVFFINLNAGRPVNEDIATMKVVLDAAPEIGASFGIIIPKVTKGSAKNLKKDENYSQVYAGIFNEGKISYLTGNHS